jgi:hypothetical protein
MGWGMILVRYLIVFVLISCVGYVAVATLATIIILPGDFRFFFIGDWNEQVRGSFIVCCVLASVPGELSIFGVGGGS